MSKSRRRPKNTFQVGDKILALQNGRRNIGVVKEVDEHYKLLKVEFRGTMVEVSFSDALPLERSEFECGSVVEVLDGPFFSFQAVVEEVNYEQRKLKVNVLIFGRSTPAELDFSQVKLVQ